MTQTFGILKCASRKVLILCSPMSLDEAYLDITTAVKEKSIPPEDIVQEIRDRIVKYATNLSSNLSHLFQKRNRTDRQCW